jgi:glucose-6-phosphate 1-dehydrogenase
MTMQPSSRTSLPDFDLALFGATGDLAMRKLVPALFERERAGEIPASARLIGLARMALTPESFRAYVDEHAKPHLHSPAEPDAWQTFLARFDYVPVDAGESGGYRALGDKLRRDTVRLIYLATPPSLFIPISECLAANSLISEHTRIVLEKPLGHDLESARHINLELRRHFREEQIFRIDHYLGKETVQNLLALRFGNILFEPLWRREWISDVQITLAEELGVGGRADYYDKTGALRDMVQNHMLQLLCIVAMEPPTSIAPDAVRDEKLKVLRALKRFTGNTVHENTVRGQYRSGSIDGQPVKGYLQEQGVATESRTETFVAIKTEIETWRWAGVPFYLRTGKRMGERVSEIMVRFKPLPHSIFSNVKGSPFPNSLIIRLQPDEGLSLNVMAKKPGDGMRLRPVALALDFDEIFSTRRMEAYERLLTDALRGQLTLFTRADELEAAWEWVQPILDTWAGSDDTPKLYPSGTWGPAAATTLIGRDGLQWREDM